MWGFQRIRLVGHALPTSIRTPIITAPKDSAAAIARARANAERYREAQARIAEALTPILEKRSRREWLQPDEWSRSRRLEIRLRNLRDARTEQKRAKLYSLDA